MTIYVCVCALHLGPLFFISYPTKLDHPSVACFGKLTLCFLQDDLDAVFQPKLLDCLDNLGGKKFQAISLLVLSSSFTHSSHPPIFKT